MNYVHNGSLAPAYAVYPQERNAYLEERRQAMDQANKSHVDLKKQRDDLTNERK